MVLSVAPSASASLLLFRRRWWAINYSTNL
jgi:hypothetical protein